MEDDAHKILPNIWLGNRRSSQNEKFLINNRISTIVNITPDVPNIFKFVNYLRFNISDHPSADEDLSMNIHKIIEFMETHINKEENILIHCHAGVSRSATVLACYLMYKLKMKKSEAMEFIMNKRKITFKNLLGYPRINFGKTLAVCDRRYALPSRS